MSRIAGSQALLSSQENRAYTIDGLMPIIVVRPGSIESVSRILQFANTENLAVTPWGRNLRQIIGSPLDYLDVVLLTERLHSVVEHDVQNLTVTVEAGSTFDQLQKTVARSGQFVPLAPPAPHLSTVGGVIATNTNGPSRRAHGSCRDQLLGLSAVLANGDIVNTGGKTMKNVAGYDVTKLMVGSLGTLAVISQATFKTLPRPEYSSSLKASFHEKPQSTLFSRDLLSSFLLPTAIFWVNGRRPEVGSTDTWRLFLSFDGSHKVVKRQISHASDLLRQHKAAQVELLQGEPERQARRAVRDLPWQISNTDVFAELRFHLPFSTVFDAIESASTLAGSLGFVTQSIIFGGTGEAILYLWSDASDSVRRSQLLSLVPPMVSLTTLKKGWMTVVRRHHSLTKDVRAWMPSNSVAYLMKRIKYQFDPNLTLNPGRVRLL